MNVKLADCEMCTGCGACANICPKNAIQMRMDDEGFLQPYINKELCIDCKKCENTCPVLHPQYVNHSVEDCYAVWTEDSLRMKSSTAGVFALAAQAVLNEDGGVYGAAWTNDWTVHHIGITTEADLYKLQGSKYLQSDTEYTYQEVKRDLKNGKKVLYSGCPCQIAGLYAFLDGSNLDDLFTMEVICHGVPSANSFSKYLKDEVTENIENITAISFRDKKNFGWGSGVRVLSEDKVIYQKKDREDSWYKGFLPCMIMRRSCEHCLFSRLPRQADISLGDFWGIEKFDRSWNDGKGTEVVLVNNRKGEIFFRDIISHQVSRFEKFSLDAATDINKTILHPFRAHSGRKHFFKSSNLMKYETLVDRSLHHDYDLGIVGLWYGINYGSVLTYYTLYCLVRDLGYDPVMLPKPNNLWTERFNASDSIAQKFIWNHCNVFNTCRIQEEYLWMNDRCKDFIVGSDVVWNYDVCGKQSEQFFFLDWVESGHKKIAYAASFGQELFGTEEYKEKAKYYLKQFDAISVREEAGAIALREDGTFEQAKHVLDPVFVCRKNIYEELLNESQNRETKATVFAYILRQDMAQEKIELVDYAAALYNAEARICGNPNEMEASRRIYGERVMPVLSVEDWLYQINHCSFYIGDSYHALCFCLIFHKPFIIVYGASKYGFAGERFNSLLKLVGLEERFFDNVDDLETIKQIMEKPCDWDNVDARLAEYRMESLSWLKAALQQPIRKENEVVEKKIFDKEKRKVSDLAVRIFEQDLKVRQLENRVQMMEAERLEREQEIERNLKCINERLENKKTLLRRGLQCISDHGMCYTMVLCWKKCVSFLLKK